VIFLAILFSMLMNKLAAFISLIALTFLSTLGYNSFSTQPISEWLSNFGVFKGLGLVLYIGFPRLKFLSNLSSDLISGNMAQWSPQALSFEVIHFILLSAVIIALANFVVKRKDF